MKKIIVSIIIIIVAVCGITIADAGTNYWYDVPSYDQSKLDFDLNGKVGDANPVGKCAEFSIAMVFGFWDNIYNKNFVPYGSASSLKNPIGVWDLVRWIVAYTGSKGEGLRVDQYRSLSPRIESLSKQLDKNFYLKTTYTSGYNVTWDLVRHNVYNYGPGNFGVFNPAIKTYWDGGWVDNQYYRWTKTHAMPSQGYKSDYVKHGLKANWLIVKSTWTNYTGWEKNSVWTDGKNNDSVWLDYDRLWINWADVRGHTGIFYLTFKRYGTRSSSQDTTDDSLEQDNDYIDDAKTISANVFYKHLKGNDHDWYKVYVNAGDTIHGWVGYVHSQGDLNLLLMSPDRIRLAVSSRVTGHENVRATASKSGYYYIVVYKPKYDKTRGNLYNMQVTVTKSR